MLRAPADLSILNLRDVCCHLWLFFASANLWAIESTEWDTRNSGAQAARCWSRHGGKKDKQDPLLWTTTERLRYT